MSHFAEYVTSTAFHLSLSRAQIDMLCQFDQTGGSWRSLMTARALIDKGLLERIPDEGIRLTEAGRAVIPLIKLAGLYAAHGEQALSLDKLRTA